LFVLDGERDVARAIVRDADGRILNVDVSRLRAPELLADLGLRDFTVNAMAIPIGHLRPTGDHLLAQVIDPFGGRIDLEQRVIRAVTEGAFADDPLRTLRAVRQAGELDFRIEDATYNLIRRDAPLLSAVAAERVRDELWQIFVTSGGSYQLAALRDTGLLLHSLPEAAALAGVTQSAPHYHDVFDHTRSVMAHMERLYSLIWPGAEWSFSRFDLGDALPMLDAAAWTDLAAVIHPYVDELRTHLCRSVSAGRDRKGCLMWAALAHDWGKPATRSVDQNGRVRFLGHDSWGAQLARNRLEVLRMATKEVVHISRLVALHMRTGYLSDAYPPSRRAVYRFFRDAAGAGPDSVLLSLADYSAIQAEDSFLEPWTRRLDTAGLLLKTYFRERADRVDPIPLLDGRQIMSVFGLAPGPKIGALLEGLREAQATDEVSSSEEALAWLARQLHREGG
jgi:tRNA nucleotidyltransferase/poly(A) polymerase